jgi:hypothetical protein
MTAWVISRHYGAAAAMTGSPPRADIRRVTNAKNFSRFGSSPGGCFVASLKVKTGTTRTENRNGKGPLLAGKK